MGVEIEEVDMIGCTQVAKKLLRTLAQRLCQVKGQIVERRQRSHTLGFNQQERCLCRHKERSHHKTLLTTEGGHRHHLADLARQEGTHLGVRQTIKGKALHSHSERLMI